MTQIFSQQELRTWKEATKISKKTQTQGNQTTAFNFDPSSMSTYQQNLGAWAPFARNLFQNPYGNDMFKQESAIGQDQAGKMGQRNISNIMGNQAAMGYGQNSGLVNEMLSNAGRATSGMQANAFRSAVMNANNRAMTGLGMTQAFQPLMTGSNSNFNQTQTQSGLGTWLPQLLSAGIGAGMNAFMPGMGSSGGGGGVGAAGAGVGATGAGMGGIQGGLGSIFGSTPGYGYGSSSPSPNAFMNPFAFSGFGGK